MNNRKSDLSRRRRGPSRTGSKQFSNKVVKPVEQVLKTRSNAISSSKEKMGVVGQRAGRMEPTKGEVTSHEYQNDTVVYHNIIRELGHIRNRVDRVLTEFQDHCESSDNNEEESTEHCRQLLAKYERTQREREKLLQSLKAFFRQQLYYIKDTDDLSLSSSQASLILTATNSATSEDFLIDLEDHNFTDAWHVALNDIDRLKYINKQLIELSKEMNSLPLSNSTEYEGLMGKPQRDRIRDMFTQEAKENMRMTRELEEIANEVNFLRQQNEDLLDQKVLGDTKAKQLVETIKIAETQIKQLQDEVLAAKQSAVIASAAAKRSDSAYSQMKAEYQEMLAQQTPPIQQLPIEQPQELREEDIKRPISNNDNTSLHITLSTNNNKSKKKNRKSNKETNHQATPTLVSMTVPSKPQRPYSQIKPHKKFTPQDQMKQINKYIQKLTEKRNTPRPQIKINQVNFQSSFNFYVPSPSPTHSIPGSLNRGQHKLPTLGKSMLYYSDTSSIDGFENKSLEPVWVVPPWAQRYKFSKSGISRPQIKHYWTRPSSMCAEGKPINLQPHQNRYFQPVLPRKQHKVHDTRKLLYLNKDGQYVSPPMKSKSVKSSRQKISPHIIKILDTFHEDYDYQFGRKHAENLYNSQGNTFNY